MSFGLALSALTAAQDSLAAGDKPSMLQLLNRQRASARGCGCLGGGGGQQIKDSKAPSDCDSNQLIKKQQAAMPEQQHVKEVGTLFNYRPVNCSSRPSVDLRLPCPGPTLYIPTQNSPKHCVLCIAGDYGGLCGQCFEALGSHG